MDFLLSTVDVRLDNMKIVLDCANGAASEIAPALFESLGAEVLPYYKQKLRLYPFGAHMRAGGGAGCRLRAFL